MGTGGDRDGRQTGEGRIKARGKENGVRRMEVGEWRHTEPKVSQNEGTLKTNLRYSGNWGHWNLQRKQTKKTMGQEQSSGTLFWSPGSAMYNTAGAVDEGQEDGAQTEVWNRCLKAHCLPVQRLPNAIGLSGLLRLYNKQSNPALSPSKSDLGHFHIVSTMEMKTLFKKPHVPLFLGDVMKQ